MFGVATDGCPSMIGANQGLQGLINKWREEDHLAPVRWHHCILHQESLVAKSLNTSNVIDVVNVPSKLRTADTVSAHKKKL